MSHSIAPGLLIAVPQLMDDNFHRSVVFLIEHTSEGAFGVVINRPSAITVKELASNLGLEYGGDPEARVLIGGPVQPERGLVLHTLPETAADSRSVTDSIFVCSTPASLQRAFAVRGGHALCFAGYSGWGPGQLERELEEGAWIPAPTDEALIFDDDRQTLWDRALRQLGIDPRLLVRGGSVS